MEDGKKLEHHQRTPRYRGIGMYEKCSPELERPYQPPQKKGVKKEHISQRDEIATLAGGSQRGVIVPRIARTTKPCLGYINRIKILLFLFLCYYKGRKEVTYSMNYNHAIERGYFAMAAVCIAVFYSFTFLYHVNSGIRIAIMWSSMAILWSYPVYMLLKDKSASVLQRVIGYLFPAEIVALFSRAYAGIKLQESMDMLSEHPYNVLIPDGQRTDAV